jgi:hypothetical protein
VEKQRENLRWFAHQFQGLFYNLVTSKSDNATFNKEYAERQTVKIPKVDFQNKTGEKLLGIDQLTRKLESVKEQLENLVEYEISARVP